MRQIQEAEQLCAKEYDHVSHAWEVLVDDFGLQEITEKAHGAESRLTSLHNYLKTLSSVEKMGKDPEIKILQQQVAKLKTQ